NRHVGEQLGRGKKLDDILGEMKMVAEGVKTAKSVQQMAENYSVDMPITQQVFQVLFHDKTPESAIFDLMSRDPVHEHHSM
ncbi:MAG: glycerol-3-phosphate dehydrogenase, partial [Candidatus Marinimicrobia bacterium]|nr:glycerol-3-phosphate dehydrogenase [Candidatus Neomarinimicrobiota bacterium]